MAKIEKIIIKQGTSTKKIDPNMITIELINRKLIGSICDLKRTKEEAMQKTISTIKYSSNEIGREIMLNKEKATKIIEICNTDNSRFILFEKNVKANNIGIIKSNVTKIKSKTG